MNDESPSLSNGKAPGAPAHRLAPALAASSVKASTVTAPPVTAPLITALVVLVLAAGWLGHGPLGWAIALGLFTIVSLFVVRGLAAHHPYPRFGAANLVTLGRSGLVCALAGALPHDDTPAWPLWLVAGLAALLDAVDGWLARRSRMTSPFGARFDLEIEKDHLGTEVAGRSRLGTPSPTEAGVFDRVGDRTESLRMPRCDQKSRQ